MSALYIHIPFCKKRCSYCNFDSQCNYSLQNTYIDAVCKELNLRSKQYADVTRLDTIFVGGGTPSSIDCKLLNKLFVAVKTNFQLSQNYEWTVECNPESVNEQLAKTLVQNGINRVSLGLQSCDNNTLQTIGRLHTAQQFATAVDVLQSVGITNLNADIILGLPEKLERVLDSISYASNCGVKHISLYALEVYEDSTMYKDIACGKYSICTDSDALCDMYDKCVNLLKQLGYNRYEISNFAQSGYQCKHNLVYWHADNYLAVGSSAHWYVKDKRYSNQSNIANYIKLIKSNQDVATCYEQLNTADKMQEFVMLGLRLNEGISLSQFEQKFGVNLLKQFSNISVMIDKGYLQLIGDRLKVADDKLYVLNSILAEIL